MRIGICDATIARIQETWKYISENMSTSDIDVKLYLPDEVLMDLEEAVFACDIFITEIVFKGSSYDGIRLVSKINQTVPNCKIIFLTEYIPENRDIYDVRHENCVLKKDRDKRLIHAIKKTISDRDNEQMNYVRVYYGKTVNVFQTAEIICVKREDRLIKYVTTRGNYIAYKTLRDALEELPESFVRINGNCIINRDYMKHYTRSIVTMETGEVLKIGRTYKDGFFR